LPLVPIGANPMLPGRFAAAATQLARTGRDSEFFSVRDQFVLDSDAATAWAWTPDSPVAGTGYGHRHQHGYRGLYLLRTGQASAFRGTADCSMSALVDEADLRRRSRRLLALAREHVPDG
jgi:hypothetical protein